MCRGMQLLVECMVCSYKGSIKEFKPRLAEIGGVKMLILTCPRCRVNHCIELH